MTVEYTSKTERFDWIQLIVWLDSKSPSYF